jgi:hypothetical protein
LAGNQKPELPTGMAVQGVVGGEVQFPALVASNGGGNAFSKEVH